MLALFVKFKFITNVQFIFIFAVHYLETFDECSNKKCNSMKTHKVQFNQCQ